MLVRPAPVLPPVGLAPPAAVAPPVPVLAFVPPTAVLPPVADAVPPLDFAPPWAVTPPVAFETPPVGICDVLDVPALALLPPVLPTRLPPLPSSIVFAALDAPPVALEPPNGLELVAPPVPPAPPKVVPPEFLLPPTSLADTGLLLPLVLAVKSAARRLHCATAGEQIDSRVAQRNVR